MFGYLQHLVYRFKIWKLKDKTEITNIPIPSYTKNSLENKFQTLIIKKTDEVRKQLNKRDAELDQLLIQEGLKFDLILDPEAVDLYTREGSIRLWNEWDDYFPDRS